jgi:hypothetical protein
MTQPHRGAMVQEQFRQRALELVIVTTRFKDVIPARDQGNTAVGAARPGAPCSPMRFQALTVIAGVVPLWPSHTPRPHRLHCPRLLGIIPDGK